MQLQLFSPFFFLIATRWNLFFMLLCMRILRHFQRCKTKTGSGELQLGMNTASAAHMCVVCVCTRVHGRVYQMFGDSVKHQTSSLESGVQADRSSPQETGLKGREMLSVTGEIEYSDNGNHLLSAALGTKANAFRSFRGASSLAARVTSFRGALPHAHRCTCRPEADGSFHQEHRLTEGLCVLARLLLFLINGP